MSILCRILDLGLTEVRKRGYKRGPMAQLNNKYRPQTGKTKKNEAIKSARDDAKERIIASYRRKILRLFPSAKFDEEHVLGCSVEQFLNELAANFKEGMTWENYGEKWCVANFEKLDVKLLTNNSEAFYSHFNHASYEPKFLDELGGRLQNLRGGKKKPEGFFAPGAPEDFNTSSSKPDTAIRTVRDGEMRHQPDPKAKKLETELKAASDLKVPEPEEFGPDNPDEA